MTTLPGPRATDLAQPWLLLAGPGAREVQVGDLPLTDVAPGTRVALVIPRAMGRGRARRTAADGGIVVDRELLVFPGTSRPWLVLDDAPGAVRTMWRRIAHVPPGLTHGTRSVALALQLARWTPPQLTGLRPPGRVLLGRAR